MGLLKIGLLICSVAAAISYTSAGLLHYESYLCAAHRNFSSGLFSCHEDCQLSHGADGGACLDQARMNRYNCICGRPTGLLPAREQQCLEPNQGYIDLCNMDCQCNHGAVSGQCDYQLKACFCQGYNPSNEGCPVHTYEHFRYLARISFEIKVGKLGPAWLYKPLVELL